MLSRQLYRTSQVAYARVAVVSQRSYATTKPPTTPPSSKPTPAPQQQQQQTPKPAQQKEAPKPAQAAPQQASFSPTKKAGSSLSKQDFYAARQNLPLRMYSKQGLLASRLWVLAERQGKASVDAVAKSLASFAAELQAHPRLNTFLASPANTPEQKKVLVASLSDTLKLNPILTSFLNELADTRKAKLLPKIAKQFSDLLNARDKIVHVKLTKATQDQPQPADSTVRDILGYSNDTKVVLSVVVDPKIVGGAILQSKDRYVDKSFRSEITNLREELAKKEASERATKRAFFMKTLEAIEKHDFTKA